MTRARNVTNNKTNQNSDNVTETIVWTLSQLLSQLSNAGDPAVFAALFVVGLCTLNQADP
jgi:hypothetical protein